MKNIFLIGFMGVGKSTVADVLAKKTGAKRIEMDQIIAERQGMSISEIFDRFGEEYFRDLETGLLASISGKTNIVVSCGGGSVLREENATWMKENGKIVLLSAEPETVYERVKNSKSRPVLNGNMNVEFIKELMEKRRSRYETVADIIVATDKKEIGQICEEILREVNR